MKGRDPMSQPIPPTRAAGEPRQDVHNTNIDEDSAAAGECGTLDLANGWICRQPGLHSGGCTFEAPTNSVPT
jgi:hypothetical protein